MSVSQQWHTEWITTQHMNIKNVFNCNVANILHEFVAPFTLYLNVENAQNPAQTHFEKTNTRLLLGTDYNNAISLATYHIYSCLFGTYSTQKRGQKKKIKSESAL